jgi:arylsulfatase A-like enzyme
VNRKYFAVFLAVSSYAPCALAASGPNVIVVVVDAMRADRLGPYGATRDTTPNLNRFAGRSVVFEHVVTQSAWTVPAVTSLLTSLDPLSHRVLRYNPSQRLEMDQLAASEDTLAEMFKSAGYQTVALKKTVVVDTNRGLTQGFDVNRIIGGQMAEGTSAQELTDAASAWLGTERDPSRPFLMYLHYMDPHSSYRAPEPWYSKYKGGYSGSLTGDHMEIERRFVQNKEKASEADIAYLKGLYDAEIEYWDSQFGRFMQQLVVSGLDANTIVAVVSDHGEAFAEHGQWFHGDVWQENVHIPWIVKVPGVTPGRRAAWSQIIDVAPTLADLAGVPRGQRWQGRSHAANIVNAAAPAPGGSVYTEYGNYRALISADGMKLVLGYGNAKLYNLQSDPHETNDLAPVRGMLVDRLKAEIEARTAASRAAAVGAAPAPVALTPDQVQALKALGYVDE